MKIPVQTNSWSKTFSLLMLITLLGAADTFSQAPTVIATVSGVTPSLVVSTSTLATAFEDELNDGTTVSSTTIGVVYYSGDFWLVSIGVLAGKQTSHYTQLDRISNDLLLNQSSGAYIGHCSHPACNYHPCSSPPACSGDCNGNGVGCTYSFDNVTTPGYLGTFH